MSGLTQAWRNLTTPRLTPILLGLLLTFALLHALSALLHQRFSDLPLERRIVDDSSYISHMANNAIFAADERALVLLGSSVTREAFPSDATLSAQASKRFGLAWRVLNLGESSQSLAESIAILETLDALPDTIVAFQVTFRRLGYSLKDLQAEYLAPRMPFLDYDSVRPIIPLPARIQHDLTPQVLRWRKPYSYYRDVRACSLHHFLFDPDSKCYRLAYYKRHWYDVEDRMTKEEKEAFLRRIERLALPKFVANAPDSLLLLRRLVTVAEENDYRLILVDYPLPPSAHRLEAMAQDQSHYNESLDELGVPRIDERFNPDFSEDDFYDTHHLVGGARQRWANILLERLETFAD